MKRKVIYTAILCLLISSGSIAQVGKLKGKVTNQSNQKPIPFVTIMLSDSSKCIASTASGSDGRYKFDSIPPGNYIITASYNDFEEYFLKDLKILAGSTRIQNIVMRESAILLQGPVISDYRVSYTDRDSRTSTGATVTTTGTPIYVNRITVTNKEENTSKSGTGSEIRPGQLTAGEINDFSKWILWNDESQEELSQYKKTWKIYPSVRFSVFIQNQNGIPLIGEKVILLDAQLKIVWESLTDNFGKAELWANMFGDEYSDTSRFSLMVKSGKDLYTIKDLKQFHEGVNQLTINKKCEVSEILDVVFVVDATGSMGDELEYLKVELNDVINKVKEKNERITFRLGSVFYRDKGDEYIVRKTGISENINKGIHFIQSQNAAGGGDYPEAVDAALNTAIHELSWHKNAITKIIFLVLDAPPHQTPEIIKKMQELTLAAAATGIKIIPISSSGINKSTEYLMRSMALGTNGTYVFLTDHSGIGDKHIAPTTDKYEVEKLNSLLIRILNQYTSFVSCNNEFPIATEEISDTLKIAGLVKAEIDQNSTVTGITESENAEFACRFYPNPTSGLINIEVTGPLKELFLTDLSGKIVERFIVENRSLLVIDIAKYPTGVYLLTYFGRHNKPYSAKILLMK